MRKSGKVGRAFLFQLTRTNTGFLVLMTNSSMEEIRDRMAKIVQFVSDYRWIYDVQITRLFAEQWWKTIPDEWREPLIGLTVDELNQLPVGLTKATCSWPSSLKMFILLSQQLSLSRSIPPSVAIATVDISSRIKARMTPKKSHEVSHLAGVVKDLCATANCQLVLDIGSGLGYLGDCLCEQCGVCVVGVERETERLTAAKKREHFATQDDEDGESYDHQGKSYVPQAASCDMTEWGSYLNQVLPVNLKSPFHVSLQLNVDSTCHSTDKFSQLLLHLQDLRFVEGALCICVVGLHCCGDLTPSILTLFTDHTLPPLPSLTALVLVGCCYHKTGTPQWSPVSHPARELMRDRGDMVVNTYALRLAAQETRERWQGQSVGEHREHERRVAYRGMLEAVSNGKNLPRRALRRLKVTSMEEYAKAIATNLNDPHIEQELLSYYATHKSFIKLIEPFTALQVCLQGVLETLLLEDRLCLLLERGIHSAKLVPIFDPAISPRNIALVATKT